MSTTGAESVSADDRPVVIYDTTLRDGTQGETLGQYLDRQSFAAAQTHAA